MKKFLRADSFLNKNIKIFFVSVAACLSLCIALSAAAMPRSAQNSEPDKNESGKKINDQTYKSPPLKDYYSFIISFSEKNLLVSALFFPKTNSCEFSAMPSSSIKNSRTYFSFDDIKKSSQLFFGYKPEKYITVDNKGLTNLTDHAGGIIIDTPYGMVSAAGSGRIIEENEELTVYGESFEKMLGYEETPTTAHLSYYAKMTAELFKKCSLNMNKKDFVFFLNQCRATDISYVDFLDNIEFINRCFENVNCTAKEGIWINKDYYLYK